MSRARRGPDGRGAGEVAEGGAGLRQNGVPGTGGTDPLRLGRWAAETVRVGGGPEVRDRLERIQEMAFASKAIAREVRRAALVGRLGLVGRENASGEAQKKLDVYANDVVVGAFRRSGLVAAVVSEELEELHVVRCSDDSPYLLSVDPLDGSSNTDVNGAVGTIFGFYRRPVEGACTDCEAELRGGAELVAAGYTFYGPSTLFAFTVGDGVVAATLDHDLGEFLVSHDGIECPARGRYWSANLGNLSGWRPEVRSFVSRLMERRTDDGGPPRSLRYSGALVADVHRTLLEGGIFFYPGQEGAQDGKLRLLYECAPLALVAEQAGGRASTGRRRILDVVPDSLHQRVPFAVGSASEVARYERFVQGAGR